MAHNGRKVVDQFHVALLFRMTIGNTHLWRCQLPCGNFFDIDNSPESLLPLRLRTEELDMDDFDEFSQSERMPCGKALALMLLFSLILWGLIFGAAWALI